MSDEGVGVGLQPAPQGSAGPAAGEANRLRPGAVSLPGTIAQSVTVMGPAVSAAFVSYLAAIKAGGATPLAFVLGMGAVLLMGGVVSEFALRLPSAGSLYTFAVNGLGSFWGFVVGWTYSCAAVLVCPPLLAGFAVFTSLVMANLGAPHVVQQWWLWYCFGLAVYLLLSYFGIQFSTRAQLVFTAASVTTLMILALIIVGKGGAHGNTLDAFRPGVAGVSWPLVFGGFGFAIFSFLGFEAAAVLGEETSNPRRDVPLAVMGSIVLVGAFYVFVTYATSIGYGVREATTAWPQSAGGLSALTGRYAPYLGDWVLLAAGLSALFSGLAAHNVVARILYAMGREGALPRMLGRTHRIHRTPHVAIVVNLVLMAAVAAVIIGAGSQASRDAVGASPGPLSSGFYLFAEGVTISTPLAMLCFMLVSVAGVRFGLKTSGSRLGMGRRLAVAAGSLLASTVGLGGSLYYSFAELTPGGGIPGPYRAVPLVGALLVAVGGVLALTLRTRKPDVWRRMGALFK